MGGVDQLEGLLERMGDDVLDALLAVPGAITPKPAHDLVQLEQGSRKFFVSYFLVACGHHQSPRSR